MQYFRWSVLDYLHVRQCLPKTAGVDVPQNNCSWLAAEKYKLFVGMVYFCGSVESWTIALGR